MTFIIEFVWPYTLNATNNQRLRNARDNDRRSKRKFHVTSDQKTRDQITSDRRSKFAWSNCVMCIPFILTVEVRRMRINKLDIKIAVSSCLPHWLRTVRLFRSKLSFRMFYAVYDI